MKEKIIEKLFSGEELTSEEIIYVSKSLNASTVGDVTLKEYNHESDNTLTACGMEEDDLKFTNKELKKIFKDDEVSARKSALTERVEILAYSDPKILRCVILDFVRMKMSERESNLPPEIQEIKDIIQKKLGGKGHIEMKVVKGLPSDLAGDEGLIKFLSQMDMMKELFELKKKLEEKRKKEDEEGKKDSE